jgi:hypothetical protein
VSRASTFWERRRAAVAAEEGHETATRAAQEVEHRTEAQSDEEILAALDLPDPDTLKAGDDFSAFLRAAVPQHLKTRALRRLWRSNPVLACLDGLNDYDDDYLTGSTGNGPLKTAYQVGKGLMAHVDAQKAASADAAPIAEFDAPEEEAQTLAEAPDAVAVPAPDEPDAVTEAVTPTPRRMRFHFEDQTA